MASWIKKQNKTKQKNAECFDITKGCTSSLAMDPTNQNDNSEMKDNEFKIWIIKKLNEIQENTENHHKDIRIMQNVN